VWGAQTIIRDIGPRRRRAGADAMDRAGFHAWRNESCLRPRTISNDGYSPQVHAPTARWRRVESWVRNGKKQSQVGGRDSAGGVAAGAAIERRDDLDVIRASYSVWWCAGV